MSDVNNIVIEGRLTSAPETREFDGGKSKTSFGLASNRRWGGDNEDTTFVDVDCWGKLGEIVAKYCDKGKPVTVIGRLSLDRWTSNDGQKRSKLYITASDVSFGAKQAGAGDSKAAVSTALNNLSDLVKRGIPVDTAIAAVLQSE
jgi:single-strand DNA-binding protein